ncbi:zinc-dependent alcohol dehydrogenase family protein [Planotetraspora phitsanulokensis]|uniref:enoyl-[acyl-carrier-protein] reductase n=1 Tax=Planotetraspora phitsanulokensis TaxID=575192 RepID=A0A8J3UDP3_9ACTN|nr:zinc-dependent alcohol dehydrogenase family protein [Planotetraspora phitsanulokensis]GII42611.1 trans-2-enoyl-CoA reductase [Planotetraspora phitsanulokensis]
MSRILLTKLGGDAESFRLDDAPVPAPGPGDLLVALEAAPVNPADFLLSNGWYAVLPELPFAMGAEGVGRVIAAGSAADQALVGRRVLVLPTYEQGTWADRIVVPARNVITVGEAADALQLAMLGVNPVTAHHLLNRYVSLKPDDWIGLTLANSTVGQNVIALAKRAGVRTLAVVRREEAAEHVRKLGADAVIVDDGENLGDKVSQALDGAKLRLFLDGIGGADVAAQVAPSIETGGAFVTFSSVTGQPPVMPLGELVYREISVHGIFVINWVWNAPREEIEQVYAGLAELVEKGVLSASVEATYSLDQYREAIAHAQRPERSGKVLFTFDQAGRADTPR